MWWHKLKIIGGMVFLLAFAGCSTVTIGQLDERVSAKLSSVSVVATDGGPDSSIAVRYAKPFMFMDKAVRLMI